MATPNQGPAPNPNAGTNTTPNLPIRDIDLSDSTFHSDGQSQQPQVADLTMHLDRLTHQFERNSHYAATLGYTSNFIGGLPQGFVLELRTRHSQIEARAPVDYYINGHPSGGQFRSVREFAKHVYHIMRDDLVKCDCSLCWRVQNGAGGNGGVGGTGGVGGI